MHYSRNLSKVAIAKRVITLCLIVGMCCVSIGMMAGYALKTHIIVNNLPKEEIQTIGQVKNKIPIFGECDRKIPIKEVAIDWGVGDLIFTPLDIPMSEEEQEFVFYLAAGYNIDFTLVMALMQHESSFRADAVSKTNDYGLMQINQVNHKYLTDVVGVTDFLDPYQNVKAGMFTLSKLFERYKDTDMVLMAYNMGEAGATKLWDKGVYETNYTQSILKIQQQFNEELVGGIDAGKLEEN